ncbi:hypothetical protein BS78_02G169800 [Paspalum vaginatum]|nr:hypothetical protein BS78_02G169800 [Paspalum vaginatum]
MPAGSRRSHLQNCSLAGCLVQARVSSCACAAQVLWGHLATRRPPSLCCRGHRGEPGRRRAAPPTTGLARALLGVLLSPSSAAPPPCRPPKKEPSILSSSFGSSYLAQKSAPAAEEPTVSLSGAALPLVPQLPLRTCGRSYRPHGPFRSPFLQRQRQAQGLGLGLGLALLGGGAAVGRCKRNNNKKKERATRPKLTPTWSSPTAASAPCSAASPTVFKLTPRPTRPRAFKRSNLFSLFCTEREVRFLTRRTSIVHS